MLAFSAGFPRAPGALLHFAALALRPQVADGKAAFLKKWRKVGLLLALICFKKWIKKWECIMLLLFSNGYISENKSLLISFF